MTEERILQISNEALVRRIHAEIIATIDAAETAIRTLKDVPGPLAQTFCITLHRGAGHFRECAANIEHLYRARNTAALERRQRS